MKSNHHQNFSERSPSRLKPRFDRLTLKAKRTAATRRINDSDEDQCFRI